MTASRRLRAAVVLSSLLFLVSAAAAVGQLAWSDRIERSDGCGFDGVYYCAMVRGEVVSEPFSRRILLPFLVRHVSADGLAGFWVVNVLSLVGATVIAMYVASRLRVSDAAASSRAHQIVPVLLVSAVFLSARNTFHLVAGGRNGSSTWRRSSRQSRSSAAATPIESSRRPGYSSRSRS